MNDSSCLLLKQGSNWVRQTSSWYISCMNLIIAWLNWRFKLCLDCFHSTWLSVECMWNWNKKFMFKFLSCCHCIGSLEKCWKGMSYWNTDVDTLITMRGYWYWGYRKLLDTFQRKVEAQIKYLHFSYISRGLHVIFMSRLGNDKPGLLLRSYSGLISQDTITQFSPVSECKTH